MPAQGTKSDNYFAHFHRLFASPAPSMAMGFETVGAAEVEAADFSEDANRERMDKTSDELARIVRKYLSKDPNAKAIAEQIRREGGEALRRLGQQDESLLEDRMATSQLEVIAVTDGTRPSFLITDGQVDTESSVLGTWETFLNSNAQQIEAAIACVGRIDLPGTSAGFVGTGFLIHENLVVTNRHVLQGIGWQEGNGWQLSPGAAIDFGHEFGGRPSVNRRAIKKVVFVGSKEIEPSSIDHSKLDLALLELEAAKAGPTPFFQLDTSKAWKVPNATVYTIGYPGPPVPGAYPPSLLDQLFRSTFGYKRLAPGEVKPPLVPVSSWTLAHDATTLGGNSGSVIVAVGENGTAAGLHYGGKWSEPRENWGHVLADVLDEVDTASGKSLRDVLIARGVAVPQGGTSTGRSGTRPTKKEPVSKPPSPVTTSPVSGLPVSSLPVSNLPVQGDGHLPQPPKYPAKVTLQMMRPLGVRPGATRLESMELEAAGDGETPASQLRNRHGYLPDFLEGWDIELPRPGGDMRQLRRGGSGTELKYQHFSVIMSASRKLPIITATNVDGSESRRLPRIDRWRYDGRLDRDDQWGNELYKNNDLDRGHMVRREDPVWGSLATAQRANVDTFHYTNSCPQMAGVNQQTWLGLEDYILQHAREDSMRICVFTGPFFTDDDFPYRGALVPKAFWKIVAFLLEDGRPSATAYKVSQTRELEELEFVYSAYKTFQISIRQVAEATGIDFSGLIPYDGFSEHESTHGGVLEERIEHLSQIRV